MCSAIIVNSKVRTRVFAYKVAENFVNKSVRNDDLFMYETEGICDACNQNLCKVLSVMPPVFVNIFLNNYTKINKNKKSAKGEKRKLRTLT